MLPLFRAVLKFCSTNRLFRNITVEEEPTSTEKDDEAIPATHIEQEDKSDGKPECLDNRKTQDGYIGSQPAQDADKVVFKSKLNTYPGV